MVSSTTQKTIPMSTFTMTANTMKTLQSTLSLLSNSTTIAINNTETIAATTTTPLVTTLTSSLFHTAEQINTYIIFSTNAGASSLSTVTRSVKITERPRATTSEVLAYNR